MTETSKPTIGHVPVPERRALCSRVRGEFLDMPGLVLTQTQATRLFGLQPECCTEVLSDLVNSGFLATDGRRFLLAH